MILRKLKLEVIKCDLCGKIKARHRGKRGTKHEFCSIKHYQIFQELHPELYPGPPPRFGARAERITIQCEYCGKSLEYTVKQLALKKRTSKTLKFYCDRKCSGRDINKKLRKKRYCVSCNVLLPFKNRPVKYCDSPDCRKGNRAKKKEEYRDVQCSFCGITFQRRSSRTGKGLRLRFHNHSCRMKYFWAMKKIIKIESWVDTTPEKFFGKLGKALSQGGK